MEFLKANFETEEGILKSIDKIAERFSKDIQLQINEAFYRIVDFEFYIYSEKFPDPHTYKHDIQLQSNKFYLHGSGIDITFGDGKNHGGILLRSIVKLYDGAKKSDGSTLKQTNGPQNVATEIFSNLNPLNGSGENNIRLLEIVVHSQGSQFKPGIAKLKTNRVGLTPKKADQSGYYLNLELRYIVLLPPFPNFKQSVKGIEAIIRTKVAANELTPKDAEGILGYIIKL